MSQENDKPSQEPFDRIDFPWMEHCQTPTSDVQKIARETAYELFGEDEAKHEAIALLHKAIAQGRAPLVAELKNIAEADLRKWYKGYDTPADFMRWAQSRARAALTGTGEK
jgi:hypothetical protein